MELKRIAAGILAAATVFTASAATLNNGTSLFSETAITASADNACYFLDSQKVVYDGLVYKYNSSKKTLTLDGLYSNVSQVVVPYGIDLRSDQTAYKSKMGYYTVTDISTGAFKDKPVVLKTVDLSRATKIDTIPSECFKNCENLYSVKFPSSLKWILTSAFENTGLRYSKNDGGVEKLVIPNSVTNIGANAFKNCKRIERLTFESGGSDLFISSNAFKNCERISEVYFDRTSVKAAADIFDGCGTCLKTYGYGAQNYAKWICRNLLSNWGLKWNSNFTEAEQRNFFDTLMTKLNGYVKPADLDQQAQEGNTATVISIRKGTCGGYSRLYWMLCREAGVPNDRVLVGGDCHCHAFNYVKIGDKWYNIDATNNVKACNKAAYSYWFGNDPKVNGVYPHRPENWYVLVDDTIGTTDSQQYLHSFTLKIDDLIAHHREGSVYITGTRA